MPVCAQCENYTGMNDWDIACKSKHGPRLCYEDTDASSCTEFIQTTKCINRTSYIGMFRCSICNFFCKEDTVQNICPNCKNQIIGATWGTQKHFQ